VVERDSKSRVARRKEQLNLRSTEKLRAVINQSSINGGGEVVLYEAPDGQIRLDVRLERETVWLTQSQIAKLFGVNVPGVSKHIRNIYATRELQRKATVSKMEIVQTEGKRQVSRPVDLYSLDMIISVGYRVNSARATQFRIWATRTLKDHLLRGYTLNEKRLRERGLGEIEQDVGLLPLQLSPILSLNSP